MTPNCRDCKHCIVRRPTDSNMDECGITPTLGSGAHFACYLERRWDEFGCTRAGKYFQVKRPWWAFWRKK